MDEEKGMKTDADWQVDRWKGFYGKKKKLKR